MSGLVHTKWTHLRLFKHYIERHTLYTYLLCLPQCVSLLLTPVSVPSAISLWILSLLIIRGVCYLQSPFHDLLRNKKQGYISHLSNNCSIALATHLPLPFASVSVNKDTCVFSNRLSEFPSVSIICIQYII